MIRYRLRVIGLTCTVLFVLLIGCGIPGDLKEEAKNKIEKIASARESISQQKSEYLDLTKTEKFVFFSVYAEREEWAEKFKEAEDLLNQAENSLTEGRVSFLLKENKKDKAGALRVELAVIDKAILNAFQAAIAPQQRMEELVNIKDNATQLIRTSENSFVAINGIIGDLKEHFIPKSQEDHPNRTDEILKRFEPLKQLQNQAETSLATAQAQYKIHMEGGVADYAILGAETDQVNKNHETLNNKDGEYRANISELYKSYTKILEDMRIDYYVKAGRVSWDDNSDFWREHNYIYPPSQVNGETYEYFSDLNPNAIPARYYRSFRSQYRSNVPVQYWNALKIDPTRNWPARSDNIAEFWIEDFYTKAYHKYILLEDGKRQNTEWVEVDEEDYFEYYDFLGMEIVSKPYGFFEDERIEEASPPGMAYVGDNRYGEWRTDNRTGRSFWYYYGIYSFLNRGHGYYYYRDDWQRWRRDYRNKEPFYGGGSAGSVYGTGGSYVRTDSRYRNSDFARKGGLRAQTPSVRGAGPSSRGGGPGGRGK